MSEADKLQDALITFLKEEAAATKQMSQNNKETLALLKVHLESVANEMGGFRNDFKKFTEKAEKVFVTQIEFKPVKGIVYGLITMILVAFATALILLVIPS